MAQLISFEHLNTALNRTKKYADDTFSTTDHNHDGKYTTEDRFAEALAYFEEMAAKKADIDHEQASNSITKMTGYVKAEEASEINENDTLNEAIGKLEKNIDTISNQTHDHDDKYLKIEDTAAAAVKLKDVRSISIQGAISGIGVFDGTEDVSINASLSDITSDKITSLKGYIKPGETSSIDENDSLNVAIGKLEKAIDSNSAIQALDEEVASMLEEVFSNNNKQ